MNLYIFNSTSEEIYSPYNCYSFGRIHKIAEMGWERMMYVSMRRKGNMNTNDENAINNNLYTLLLRLIYI
jgi:hypothetical protein